MPTSDTNQATVEPVDARVTAETLTVWLADGRTVSVPTKWFPRLAHGSSSEWKNFELSYEGIHWPDLNEDIAVESLLRGERSGESAKSIRRWLSYRARGEKEPIPTLPLPPRIVKELRAIGVLPRKIPNPSPVKRQKRAG